MQVAEIVDAAVKRDETYQESEPLTRRTKELLQQGVGRDAVFQALNGEFGSALCSKYSPAIEAEIMLHERNNLSASVRRRPSLAGSKIELPRLVACVAGCGFWGKSETKNLCNKCFLQLKGATRNVSDRQALEHMMRRLGFNSLYDYKLDMVFEDRFPAEAAVGAHGDSLPGVTMWHNTQRPLTQFDKAPERGTTACTYVSGVTALRANLRGEFSADSSEWSDSIIRGVVAFHAAAKANPNLRGHSHIVEALPYAMEVLGFSFEDASQLRIEEKVVLLYMADELQGCRPSEWLGERYSDAVGPQAVAEVISQLLQEHTSLVVTRPPETWAITRSSTEGGKVRLRDSHRRLQFDFQDIDVFVTWINTDQAYFAPVPATGIDMNSVSISAFVRYSQSNPPSPVVARAEGVVVQGAGPVIIASSVAASEGPGESKLGVASVVGTANPAATPATATGSTGQGQEAPPPPASPPPTEPQSAPVASASTVQQPHPHPVPDSPAPSPPPPDKIGASLQDSSSPGSSKDAAEAKPIDLAITPILRRLFISGSTAASDPAHLRGGGYHSRT